MKETFQKNPTEVKKTPEDFKIKRQTFLTDIGGTWYLNDKTPIKRPILN